VDQSRASSARRTRYWVTRLPLPLPPRQGTVVGADQLRGHRRDQGGPLGAAPGVTVDGVQPLHGADHRLPEPVPSGQAPGVAQVSLLGAQGGDDVAIAPCVLFGVVVPQRAHGGAKGAGGCCFRAGGAGSSALAGLGVVALEEAAEEPGQGGVDAVVAAAPTIAQAVEQAEAGGAVQQGDKPVAPQAAQGAQCPVRLWGTHELQHIHIHEALKEDQQGEDGLLLLAKGPGEAVVEGGGEGAIAPLGRLVGEARLAAAQPLDEGVDRRAVAQPLGQGLAHHHQQGERIALGEAQQGAPVGQGEVLALLLRQGLGEGGALGHGHRGHGDALGEVAQPGGARRGGR